MEGCSTGARGSKQTRSLKFHAFAEDLVVFEVFTVERAGDKGGGPAGKERARIEREGEQVTEV